MKPITTTQSTSVSVTHNSSKETVTDLYELIDGFRQDTCYCIQLQMTSYGTEIYLTNMEVSESGEVDDTFQDAVQQLIESLEDLDFTVE